MKRSAIAIHFRFPYCFVYMLSISSQRSAVSRKQRCFAFQLFINVDGGVGRRSRPPKAVHESYESFSLSRQAALAPLSLLSRTWSVYTLSLRVCKVVWGCLGHNARVLFTAIQCSTNSPDLVDPLALICRTTVSHATPQAQLLLLRRLLV